MKKKKCYVLMVSKVFPATHPRKGESTGFAETIGKQKKHTIRSNFDLWKKRIEEINLGIAYLSVRQWTGKPYKSKMTEIATYESLHYEKIWMEQFATPQEDGSILLTTNTQINDAHPQLTLKEIAHNDGLEYHDFKRWFFPAPKHQSFNGIIIHFTEFNYRSKQHFSFS